MLYWWYLIDTHVTKVNKISKITITSVLPIETKTIGDISESFHNTCIHVAFKFCQNENQAWKFVLGPYSQKALGLNVLYQSSKFKAKTWQSPFVNTSPGETVVSSSISIHRSNQCMCICISGWSTKYSTAWFVYCHSIWWRHRCPGTRAEMFFPVLYWALHVCTSWCAWLWRHRRKLCGCYW